MDESTFQLWAECIKQTGKIKVLLSFASVQWSVEDQQLIESANLYAEVYTEDEELQALTQSTVADWPE